jgi:hypothetical protein
MVILRIAACGFSNTFRTSHRWPRRFLGLGGQWRSDATIRRTIHGATAIAPARIRMNSNELKGALRKLKSELESRRALDPELRALLEELDGDIHDALRGGASENATPRGLIERAEALEVRFAVRNPEIEGLLREVIDALARMGI